VRSVAAARGGRVIVTAGGDGTARIWSAGRRLPRVLRHGGDLTTAVTDRDGKILVTAGTDHVARVWDLRTGELRHVLSGHDDAVVAVAIDRRGTRVATASEDGTAVIWDTRSGDQLHRLVDVGDEAALTAVRFSPSSGLLATASVDGDVRIWNVRTGREAQRLEGHGSTVSEVSFSPDGRWVVTAGPSAAGVWELRTGKLLFFLRPRTPRPLTAASFSRDGKRVVTGSVDGTVHTRRCNVCTGIRGLRALARARLNQVVRATPPAAVR
jgi:WD40 repeat protein